MQSKRGLGGTLSQGKGRARRRRLLCGTLDTHLLLASDNGSPLEHLAIHDVNGGDRLTPHDGKQEQVVHWPFPDRITGCAVIDVDDDSPIEKCGRHDLQSVLKKSGWGV